MGLGGEGYIYRSERLPRTGYFIPVRDGVGREMLENPSAAAVVAVAAAAVPSKVGVFWLPFPSRMGSRIEISGHPSEHPAQNCATVFLYFHMIWKSQKIADFAQEFAELCFLKICASIKYTQKCPHLKSGF